jgi:hypothetical protein
MGARRALAHPLQTITAPIAVTERLDRIAAAAGFVVGALVGVVGRVA